MTSVSLPGESTPLDARVINATQTSPEYPFNEDMSGGDHSLLGVGWLQSSAGGGVRSSSSTSYLAAAKSRPNLTVLVNATVLKLVQTGVKNGAPSFKKVQFGSSPGTGSTPAGKVTVLWCINILLILFICRWCPNDSLGQERSYPFCRISRHGTDPPTLRNRKPERSPSCEGQNHRQQPEGGV